MKMKPYTALFIGIVMALIGGYGWATRESPETIISTSIAIYATLIISSSILIFPNVLHIINSKPNGSR
jgi:hypothetical protein